jgi:hypothetical protein
VVKVTRHADELNARAAATLCGLEDFGDEALAELFGSDRGPDRQVLDLLAALVRKRKGLRLKLIRDKPHRPFVRQLATWHEYQQIADEVDELIRGGDVPKMAKAKVMDRRGISLAKVKDALRYARRTLFRVSRRDR